MEFFGQGAHGFGEKCDLFDPEGLFAHLGDKKISFDTDDITDIQFFEESKTIFAHLIFGSEKLQFAAAVAHVSEDRFTHAAFGDHTSGGDGFRTDSAFFFGDGFFADIADFFHIVEGAAEGIDAVGTVFGDFCTALFKEFVGTDYRSFVDF